jgi:hypothetical protein
MLPAGVAPSGSPNETKNEGADPFVWIGAKKQGVPG